ALTGRPVTICPPWRGDFIDFWRETCQIEGEFDQFPRISCDVAAPWPDSFASFALVRGRSLYPTPANAANENESVTPATIRRMAAVTLRDLTKLYPASRSGVRGVSLDIAAGEHFVLVGPSGAGKTTLLRLIAGLETPDGGSVAIAGRDVTHTPPYQRRVALVAQRPALYPHLSVRRNLAAGVEFRQGRGRWWRWLGRLVGRKPSAGPDFVPPAELDARVTEAARVLGL